MPVNLYRRHGSHLFWWPRAARNHPRKRVICDRSKAERIHKAGKSLTEIGAEVGVSKSSLHCIISEFGA
jgi:hypothetical protein